MRSDRGEVGGMEGGGRGWRGRRTEKGIDMSKEEGGVNPEEQGWREGGLRG